MKKQRGHWRNDYAWYFAILITLFVACIFAFPALELWKIYHAK